MLFDWLNQVHRTQIFTFHMSTNYSNAVPRDTKNKVYFSCYVMRRLLLKSAIIWCRHHIRETSLHSQGIVMFVKWVRTAVLSTAENLRRAIRMCFFPHLAMSCKTVWHGATRRFEFFATTITSGKRSTRSRVVYVLCPRAAVIVIRAEFVCGSVIVWWPIAKFLVGLCSGAAVIECARPSKGESMLWFICAIGSESIDIWAKMDLRRTN